MADIFSEMYPEILKGLKHDFPIPPKKRERLERPYIIDSVVKRGSEEYEYLIQFVQQHIGDQSQEVLHHAANALLFVIKLFQVDKLDHCKKKQEIMDTLNLKQTIPDDTFHRLLSISMLTTDKEPSCRLLDLKGLASLQQSLDAQRVIHCRMDAKYHPRHTEFHVPPPLKDLPTKPLLKIDTMPEIVQSAFRDSEHMNLIASHAYQTAFCTKDNFLICAPAGAGERDVAVLAILEQIASNTNNTSHIILYITPTRASVKEVIHCLSARLLHCDVEVKDLSKHKILSSQIQQTQIFVSTPEIWDADYKLLQDQGFTKLVKLFIIDKIHLLHDPNRGPLLECIVTRALRETKTSGAHVRFLGLCATLPNYEDIASFLNVDPTKDLFFHNNTFRPYPLNQYHCEMFCFDPLADFWLMENLCHKKTMEAALKHQVLVFVYSTTETTRTARNVRDTAVASPDYFLSQHSASLAHLTKHAEFVENKDLKNLLPCGFAIYHAEMASEDRQLVENLFSDGHVQVLVATVDLAWGTNLSADTVIIKGTQPYSHLDVLQMFSCAGRSQCGSLGEVTILSARSLTATYLALTNEQLPIESQLVSKLHDRLNAEILLGTVKNAREATDWIHCTYLYFRMLAKPTLYGLSPEELSRDCGLTQRISDLVHSAATILARSNSIKYDPETGDFSL